MSPAQHMPIPWPVVGLVAWSEARRVSERFVACGFSWGWTHLPIRITGMIGARSVQLYEQMIDRESRECHFI